MSKAAEPKPKWTAIDKLKPHPRNYRRHPDVQIEHLMQSITEHGFYRNVVTARDGTILAGHGVIEASKKLGRKKVLTVHLDIDPESPQALKLMAGDNTIANLAEDDDRALAEILKSLHQADELLGTGFDADMLAALEMDALDNDGKYTAKIESPVYEVTGDEPSVDVMYDGHKTRALIEQIEKAELADDVRGFLLAAAQRHTAFRYDHIAEFYAHQAPEVQRLMEDSALVVIDFDRAIELGFVRLAHRLAEAQGVDHA